MLLAVDIGNSNITFGIYNKNDLLKTFRLVSDINTTQETYSNLLKSEISEYKITDSIISSVVNQLDIIIKNVIDKLFNINSLVFDSETKININLRVDNPFQVGKDRIANSISASKYPLPAVVIDFGTATTFDIIDKNGDFIGGIIMPGINTQLKSLNDSTSLLPKITPEETDIVIGKNTKDSILSGVILAHASAIEGLISKCENELSESLYIIGTGGFANLIGKYMKIRSFDIIDSNITLNGLKMIYELNYKFLKQ